MYSIAGKSNVQDKNFVPGPGTYNAGSGDQTGPSYSFRTKSDLTNINHSPGPGAYNPKDWESARGAT